MELGYKTQTTNQVSRKRVTSSEHPNQLAEKKKIKVNSHNVKLLEPYSNPSTPSGHCDSSCNDKGNMREAAINNQKLCESLKQCTMTLQETIKTFTDALQETTEKNQSNLTPQKNVSKRNKSNKQNEANKKEEEEIENNNISGQHDLKDTVISMVTKKGMFDEVSSLYQELFTDVNVIVKELNCFKLIQLFQERCMKHLLGIEESYIKILEMFKRQMTNLLAMNHNHSSERVPLRRKYLFWLDILSKGLSDIRSKRRLLSENWTQENNSLQMERESSSSESRDKSLQSNLDSVSVDSGMSIVKPVSPLMDSQPKIDEANSNASSNGDNFILCQNKRIEVGNCNELIQDENATCNTKMKDVANGSHDCLLQNHDSPIHKSQPYETYGINFSLLSESDEDSLPMDGERNNKQEHCEEIITIEASDCDSVLNKNLTNMKPQCNERSQIIEENQHYLPTMYENNWACKSLPVIEDFISTNENSEQALWGTYNKSNIQGNKTDKYIIDSINEVEFGYPGSVHSQVLEDYRMLEPVTTLLTPQSGFSANIAHKNDPQIELPSSSCKLSQMSNSSSLKAPIAALSMITCSICHSVFGDMTSLHSHLTSSHSPQLCIECGFIATNLTELNQHAEKLHGSSVMCQDSVSIGNQKKFRIHEASPKKSTIERSCTFKCTMCTTEFSDIEKLKLHEKTHKSLFYYCDHCDHQAESRFEDLKHKTEHLAERLKKHICKICFAHFDLHDKLLKHLKAFHFMQDNKQPPEIYCLICDFEYKRPLELIEHMKNDHRGDSLIKKSAIDECSGKKSEQCPYCDIYLKNSKVRAIHLIISHNTAPYKCGCQAQFYSKGVFDFHQLNHTKAEEIQFRLKTNKGRKI